MLFHLKLYVFLFLSIYIKMPRNSNLLKGNMLKFIRYTIQKQVIPYHWNPSHTQHKIYTLSKIIFQASTSDMVSPTVDSCLRQAGLGSQYQLLFWVAEGGDKYRAAALREEKKGDEGWQKEELENLGKVRWWRSCWRREEWRAEKEFKEKERQKARCGERTNEGKGALGA